MAYKPCLVVDDSEDNCFILWKILKDLGYDAEVFNGGEEALEYCKSTMPRIVFLDWKMPKMDGMEFYEALNKLVSERAARMMPHVVMCSAINDERSVKQALMRGVDGYVLKPFSEERIDSYLKKFRVNA